MLTKGHCGALLISALLSLAMGASSKANLIQNPNFANTGSTGVTPTTAVAIGAGNQIPGWTTTVGDAPGANNYIAGNMQSMDNWIPPAFTGTYCVQLDSIAGQGSGSYTLGNSIYQAINLTANTQYSLTFDYRSEAVQQTQAAFVNVYVSLDSKGNVPVNPTSSFYIAAQNFQTPNANGNPDTSWNHATFNFNTGSNSGLIRLTFLTVSGTSVNITGGSDDNDISLENFGLVAVVPETTNPLVSSAFCSLIVAVHAWRRKTKRLR
jgi:hypothetical protein